MVDILFGTLSLNNSTTFFIMLKQTFKENTWVLFEHNGEDFDSSNTQNIVSVLKIDSIKGNISGYGQTVILNKLLENLNFAISESLKSGDVSINNLSTLKNLNYSNNNIIFSSDFNGKFYSSISMSYDGLNLSLCNHIKSFPKIPDLLPLINEKKKSAIIANLGINTAKEAMKRFDLSWYIKDNKKLKNYYSVKSFSEFKTMMKNYLTDVVSNEKAGKITLTGVDTETTGLMTVFLDINNPIRDHIVAIPFSWKDNEAYVIFVDMVYFDNVDIQKIAEIFTPIFSRPLDFSDRIVNINIDDTSFVFHRNSIVVTGHGTIFDTRCFLTDNIDFFFDDDTMQIGFNIATDWSKGKNSLKSWTRRLFNHNTLELSDLFGSKHKDKYAYLMDEELALIYGGADADYARLVFKTLRPLLPSNLYNQYKKYDIELMHIYASSEAYGLPIDTEKVKDLSIKVKNDIETIKTFIYQYAYFAYNYKNSSTMLEIASKSNNLSKEQIESLAEKLKDTNKNKEYRFEFVPNKLKNLLYDILKYPVLKRTEKENSPALDKFVLDKLSNFKLRTSTEYMKCNIMSEADPNEILIDARKFNTDMYPLARVLSTYATLNKEYTAYYKPILENNLEGKIFSSFKTTTAATRRIINPLQTIKGKLKEYIIAPKGKLFCSFDASQIEYRHMASMAYIEVKEKYKKTYPNDWESKLNKTSIAHIHHLMHNPERDYHIEIAALLNKVKQHLVTYEQRKKAKAVGFGVPYGLGEKALCENMFGEYNEVNLKLTKDFLNLYRENQTAINDMLENAKEEAFIPYNISDDLRNILDIGKTNVGLVKNVAGFYRLFILENLTRAKTAYIRRQAGNFKIQGGAAELFRRMLHNFYMGCVKAGISKKVQWLLTVHDELDFLVDDDIDIIQLIDILYKSCTLVYKDHIPYYIGINFGHTWADAKDDKVELPVIMVQRLIKAYYNDNFRIPNDGFQAETLLKLKQQYLSDRIYEELLQIFPNFSVNKLIDIETFDNNFNNYTVRSYLNYFIPPEVTLKYNKMKLSIPIEEQLSYWALSYFKDTFADIKFKIAENIVPITSVVNFFDSDSLLSDIHLNSNFLLSDIENNNISLDEYFNENAFNSSDPTSISLLNPEIEIYDPDKSFILNDTPSDFYNVWIPTSHCKQHIFPIGENVFSVILHSTKYKSKEFKVLNFITSKATKGIGTLYLIGNKTIPVKDINLDNEFLEYLDKWLET